MSSNVSLLDVKSEDGFAGVHRDLLEGILRTLRPDNYLEIGAAFGGTLQMAANFCNVVVGVDIKDRINVHLSPDVRVYFMSSDQYFNTNLGLSERMRFDFIYIDGDHSFPQAAQDFFNSLHVLNPGGVIALHDSVPPDAKHADLDLCGEVYKLVKELRTKADLQVFTFNIMFGLTLVSRIEQIKWGIKF
jgi:predicted O-methyltransferase YrrM